jgi:short-subunit dehydrogenase
MLSAVARKELAADGIAVSLILPSITATEFGEGMFRDSANVRPGMVAHDPGYVARVILRALSTVRNASTSRMARSDRCRRSRGAGRPRRNR